MESNIGPQSSIDEIENEKIAVHVMITSLDQGDSNYLNDKTALDSKMRYYDQLLRIRSNAISPSSADHQSTAPTSATLPSRSRPNLPNWVPREPSPTKRNGPTGTLDPRALSLDGYASESSNGPKKRYRQDSAPNGMPSSSKMPRTGKIERPTTSSTSNSLDSFDDDFFSIQGEFQGPSKSDFELFRKRQQQEEERWRREQQDKEFARQLSQQAEDILSGSMPANASMSQSYLTPNGTYTLPTPSLARSQPSVSDYIKSSSQNNFESSYQPLPSNSNFRPNFSAASAQAQSVNNNWSPVGDDNDDDLQIISPEQFGASSPSTLYNRQRHRSNGDSTRASMPGSFPRSPMASSHSYVRGAQQYQPTPYQGLGDGLATIGEQMFQGVPNEWGSAQNVPTAAFGSTFHGQVGDSVFGGSYSNAQPSMFNGDGDLSREMLHDIQSRNMGYMLADPTQTREEIVQLLENIRPDEDLPPELREGGPQELNVRLMEHQKLGLAWLKKQEDHSHKGGILADDMGLGKTIQALALILDRPSSNPAVKTTLIVAPVALLRQWEKEIKTKVTSRCPLKVHIYHGSGQRSNYARLAQYDVVLTTYGTLAMEWKRHLNYLTEVEKHPENQVSKPELKLIGEKSRWYRVILDEAQAIKNRAALCSLGSHALQADYRLVMTGTPMMNNVQELYSLIRFLRIPPYHQLSEFQKSFKPLTRVDFNDYSKRKAMERLQVLLKSVLLRRMKTSKIDGKPILNLKNRIVGEAHAEFDEEQKAFYNSLEQKTQLQFNRYLKAGTIGKNYTNILVLLLRLRQACDHPNLITDHGVPIGAEGNAENMEEYAGKLSQSAVTRIKEANGAFECPICYDASENPTIFFPCGHDVCSECFARMMDPSVAVRNGDESTRAKCPECRQAIDPVKILTYTLFKKVHMPEVYRQEFPDQPDDPPPDSESGSDVSNDEDIASNDVDDHGNLKGLIAYSDDEAPKRRTKVEPTDDDRWSSSDARQTMPTKKSKSKRSKGKGKEKKKKTLAQLKKESMKNAAAKQQYLRRLRKNFVSSAKIEKTMELLGEIRNNDPTEKTIIFSQFTSFLDLLEVPISDSGWKYARYDGSMSAKHRNEAVDNLVEDRECNIMLISLKAGNAGLNLNCASQVIILDPFWNPFIEEQAIDRAHRIGQMRDVNVHRILIEGTVEDRIVALQEKKREMINTALDEDQAKNLSRLGRDELIFLFGSG